MSSSNERAWKCAEAHKAAAPESKSTTKGQAGKKFPPERVVASLPVLGLPAPSPAAARVGPSPDRGPAPRAGPSGGKANPPPENAVGAGEQQAPPFVAVAELADEELGSRLPGEMQICARGLFSHSSEQIGGRSLIRHGQRQAVFISLRINSFCLSARPLTHLQRCLSC